jgi:hypothetical protein
MFYGHPVERLCTYQYSLISLLPGKLSLSSFNALSLPLLPSRLVTPFSSFSNFLKCAHPRAEVLIIL